MCVRARRLGLSPFLMEKLVARLKEIESQMPEEARRAV